MEAGERTRFMLLTRALELHISQSERYAWAEEQVVHYLTLVPCLVGRRRSPTRSSDNCYSQHVSASSSVQGEGGGGDQGEDTH